MLNRSATQAHGLQNRILNLRGKLMRGKWNTWVGAGALTAILLCVSPFAAAQSWQSQPAQQQQPQPPPAQADKDTQTKLAQQSIDDASRCPAYDSAAKL